MDERTAPPPRAADHRVEVIVGVHTPERPVERAVASVLRNDVSLRVTVVAHNTDAAGVRERLAKLADDPRVRVLELSDGVRSPANAFNFGLDAAEGDFFSLVGSDDELTAGALDAWTELADRAPADVVMAPIRRVPGSGVPSPRVRRGRVVRLDGDRDRLFERAAPLGLVRLARFPHLRFTTGLPRGVDQVYAMHLWFSGASIAFDPAAPAYLERDDQTDRVTLEGGALADDLAYLDAMEADPAFAGMTPVARRALAAKLLRVHVLGAIASRAESEAFTDADRAAVVEVLARLRRWGRGLDGLLAVRDRRALRAATAPGTTAAQLRDAVDDRSRHATWDAVLTVNPLKVLHRHAPLRSMAAGLRVARAVTRAATRNEAGLVPERAATGAVDVIVGVHSDTRPIERVTASALASPATASVIIVAHNTDPAGIRTRLGASADDPRVRIVPLADGVRSPANAYNRGLDAAGAEYVSIIGSDDEFAPGALDAWLSLARDADADVVIAPVVRSSGGIGTTPRPRPGRTRDLDGDRDRLYERSAPLGLVRREGFPGLRLAAGVRRGEDQAYSLHLWFAGARVAYDPASPPYIEHDDQDDRVTRRPLPLADDLAFLDVVEADPVFWAMTRPARRAYAAKTLRVFVIDAIAARMSVNGIDAVTQETLRELLPRISHWAPRSTGLLSRRDRQILDLALAGATGADRLRRLVGRRSPRSVSAILPAAPWLVLHRHAPLRSMLAQRRVARAQQNTSAQR